MKNDVTQNNLIKYNVKVVVPLKYLRNFWTNLKISLINWTKITTFFKRRVSIIL